MNYLTEYRDPQLAATLVRRVRNASTRRWRVMEVCGGQTHTIVRCGIDRLLTESVDLLHGPGCPVCVTPVELIDHAVEIARTPGVILASFGDMLRVPGCRASLLDARAAGADVRVVYAPMDAVRLARLNPARPVVFFAVGFETTAPATALAVRQARSLGLTNFSVLVSHVLVTPAMEAILLSPGNSVRGFLAAGHASAVTGFQQLFELAERFAVPIVVTGFEPVDLLEGLAMLVEQLEAGRHTVENQYARVVRRFGNRLAQDAIAEVYEVCDRTWRGLGVLPASGLRLRAEFRDFDAAHRFPAEATGQEQPECHAGLVLQGRIKPDQCPAYGTRCTPDHPLGAPMVSSEGACAAYWNAGRPNTFPLQVLA